MKGEHPLDFLIQCMNVPIECSQCHALTPLGGPMELMMREDEPTEQEYMADLCDCDAPFKVYVGDAPTEAAQKLSILMDMVEMMDDEVRKAWIDTVRDELDGD
jgi:hypothetical protein